MTDHGRSTTRETQVVDPGPGPYGAAPVASTVRTTDRTYQPAGPDGMTTAVRIVTFAFGLLQVALVLRIVLLVLVANHSNDIVALILNVTNPFVEPFRGMFALDRVTADRSVFDVAALVALVAWTLVEALIVAALRIFSNRPAEAA